MNRCDKIHKDGISRKLEKSDIDEILRKNSNMADKALRVIAVAYFECEKMPRKIDSDEIEKNLIFVRTYTE